MKRLQYALLLFFAMALLALSGCGRAKPIALSSLMEIDTNESGTRTMVMSAPKSTLKAMFGSGRMYFDSFIETFCPDALSYSLEETRDSYELVFTLAFDSLDDYQAKLSAITGLPDSVILSRPKVGVKTGFTLAENVDLIQVFHWFTEAVSSRSGKAENRLSAYLLAGENALAYGGRRYPQSEGRLYCYIENLMDARRIDILTDYSLEDGWKRQVVITFPEEMLDNAENVKSYLSSLLAEETKEEWMSRTTWQLTLAGATLEDIHTEMGSLFSTAVEQPVTEQEKNPKVLEVIHAVEEPLNIAFFVPESGKGQVRYFLKDESGAQVIPYSAGGTAGDLQTVKNGYDGYVCVFDREVKQSTDFHYELAYRYQPKDILVHTAVNGLQDFARSIALSFGPVPAAHRALIEKRLLDDAGAYGQVEVLPSAEEYTISFTQSGSARQLRWGFAAAFKADSSLSFTPGSVALGRHQAYTLSETLDFSAWLADPEDTAVTAVYLLPNQISASDAGFTTEASSGLVVEASAGSRITVEKDLTGANPLFGWLVFTLVAGILAIAVFLLMRFLPGPGQKKA